jgi:histone acetyltransferase (RNA polymerase elongator complex component)
LSVAEERHLIVPIFIPHQGCPFQCIYCRQDKIADRPTAPVTPVYIKQVLDTAIKSDKFPSAGKKEVAFYGGTFANLPEARMRLMLEAVAPYLEKGLFTSIRVSTRPDSIDEGRLELMKSYGVSTVELGVQSMDDKVLMLSKRGHSSNDVVKAVELLKQHGLSVGIQLMPGLPGDSESTFISTIEKVMRLRPQMVRLYPAIVIRETELASVFQAGGYSPLTLDLAIKICGAACERLEDNGIPVIRIGLMSSPSLTAEGEILAGPWHSAFGFLVRSYIHQKKIEPFLIGLRGNTDIGIRAPSREIPLVRGYKNEGVRRMEETLGSKIVYVKSDDTVLPGTIEVDEIRK